MPSASPRPEVRAFFERFEQAANALDTTVLAELFGDSFLSLDPAHAACVPKDAFLRALPVRERLFGSIGATGTTLTDIRETPLDDLHTLVETSWAVQFGPQAQAADAALTLRSAFLLRRQDGRWQVAVYLNHQDIGAVIGSLTQGAPVTD
ncbi:MAG TPA: nuclear transport factor 2 family protein [Streptosporangiaceae bacterium]|nr:nuclear transport factor 2 family protein [Streptosporangiaceae bacterium]